MRVNLAARKYLHLQYVENVMNNIPKVPNHKLHRLERGPSSLGPVTS